LLDLVMVTSRKLQDWALAFVAVTIVYVLLAGVAFWRLAGTDELDLAAGLLLMVLVLPFGFIPMMIGGNIHTAGPTALGFSIVVNWLFYVLLTYTILKNRREKRVKPQS